MRAAVSGAGPVGVSIDRSISGIYQPIDRLSSPVAELSATGPEAAEERVAADMGAEIDHRLEPREGDLAERRRELGPHEPRPPGVHELDRGRVLVVCGARRLEAR